MLQSAEVSCSAITARKEGKAQENAPRNVKVGKTGLRKGFGASVFHEKHKIENRRSRKLLLSGTSIVFVVLSIVYSFIMGEPLGVFGLSVYMLTIGVGTGRWAKELLLPYIYLVPEKSSKKLFHILREQLPELTLESVLCFVPVYFILQLSIIETVAMILARITFGFVFIGANLVLQRFLGSNDKKFLVVSAYFLMAMVFSLPAIIVGGLLWTFLPFNMEFAYLAMAAVNVPVSALVLYCCRNILEYADYNNK